MIINFPLCNVLFASHTFWSVFLLLFQIKMFSYFLFDFLFILWIIFTCHLVFECLEFFPIFSVTEYTFCYLWLNSIVARECTLCDLNPFTFITTNLVAHEIRFVKSFLLVKVLCTFEYIFCCCSLECFINVNIKLVYSISSVFYVLIRFNSTCSVSYWDV